MWIASVVTDADGSFAMVGDGSGKLISFHVASGSLLGTADLAMVPSALQTIGTEVYCGAVDKSPSAEKMLYRFDMQCNPVGTAQTSAAGTYAIAMHEQTSVTATGGYSFTQSGHCGFDEIVDVYLKPPLRSFSMTVT